MHETTSAYIITMQTCINNQYRFNHSQIILFDTKNYQKTDNLNLKNSRYMFMIDMRAAKEHQ